jgi:flagellar biosynthetic protein FliR
MAVLSRMGAFLMAFPIFNSTSIPGKYKVFFVIIMSLVLVPIVPSGWINYQYFRNLDLGKLVFMMFSEVLLGACISLFVLCLLEIFRFGGYVIDYNMGFVMAKLIDPATGSQSTPFSGILVQVFYIIFLISDGHHEILRLAAYSFHTIPPGGFMLDSDLLQILISLSSQIFTVGLQIGFPIFAVMLMINIAMGILARVGQDFPVLMISFPIRFGVGFLIMMGVFPVIISVTRKINTELLEWIAYIVKF